MDVRKHVPLRRMLDPDKAILIAGDNKVQMVPVLSESGRPIMPCHPARARELVRKGRAMKCYRQGCFCIRMLVENEGAIQPVAIGIDPGSKMNGYSVKSGDHTFINIQQPAKDGQQVKKSVEGRASARRGRRGRKTPCRPPRFDNRSRNGCIPPSTKARWQHIYNTLSLLSKLYPISHVVVEDVKAETKKGQKRWNSNFSPLMAGKNWLYGKILADEYHLTTVSGFQTSELRKEANLKKDQRKLNYSFFTHALDGWVMANSVVGGHTFPDYIGLTVMKRYECCRRQLHVFNYAKGGIRKRYGGTILPNGLRKGTLIKYRTHLSNTGYMTLLTGHSASSGYSLSFINTAKRYSQNGKLESMQILHQTKWLIIPPHHHRGYPSKSRAHRDLRYTPESVRTHYGVSYS